MELREFFALHPRVALAFSGGVDSSYLLYAALRWAEDVGVYYVRSAFQPEFEVRDALRLAGELGAEVKLLRADVLSCPAVAANPAAFERLVRQIAPMRGFALHGEEFRRPKGDLGEILNPWYNRKYLDFGAERDHDALLFSSELPRRIAADWARLMPMCRFMVGAVQGVTPPKAEKR